MRDRRDLGWSVTEADQFRKKLTDICAITPVPEGVSSEDHLEVMAALFRQAEGQIDLALKESRFNRTQPWWRRVLSTVSNPPCNGAFRGEGALTELNFDFVAPSKYGWSFKNIRDLNELDIFKPAGVREPFLTKPMDTNRIHRLLPGSAIKLVGHKYADKNRPENTGVVLLLQTLSQEDSPQFATVLKVDVGNATFFYKHYDPSNVLLFQKLVRKKNYYDRMTYGDLNFVKIELVQGDAPIFVVTELRLDWK